MIDLIYLPFMGHELWFWGVFFVIVAVMLVLDLGVFHKEQHEIGIRESLMMSAGYISVGLLFSIWIYFQMGDEHAIDYLTGFLIEKSLSLDNIFVIALIFSALHIPRVYQHRVLFWGILGVIILRGIMIFAGAALVHEFEWILYLFAAFLIFTGIKLLFNKDVAEEEINIEQNRILLFFRKHMKVSNTLNGEKFFVRQPDTHSGKLKLYATPLLLALVAIETADVVFAVDSVPAIFTITTEPYVIYTSNIFAILGLRALYFALSAIIHKFTYLQYALSLVLIFIGAKVFIAEFMGLEKFPPAIALGVTASLLIGGVVLSLYKNRAKV